MATGVFYLRTNQFELTHVNLSSSLGFDQAFFYDGPGNDQFTAAGNQAENLYFNGARNRVNAFDAVYAYSQNGGTNRRTVTNPLLFTMTFSGTWCDAAASGYLGFSSFKVASSLRTVETWGPRLRHLTSRCRYEAVSFSISVGRTVGIARATVIG